MSECYTDANISVLSYVCEERKDKMRKEFVMSIKDWEYILDACKPVPYMVFGGLPPESPQVRANRAWENIGHKMGFKFMTVKPDSKGRDRFFTAEEI